MLVYINILIGGEIQMKYTKPVAELEKFTVADVVTTSGQDGNTGEPQID